MNSILAIIWLEDLDTDVKILVVGAAVFVAFLLYHTVIKLQENRRKQKRRRHPRN